MKQKDTMFEEEEGVNEALPVVERRRQWQERLVTEREGGKITRFL